MERLGRVLAGQAMGLVLSGGRSRCLAQVGAIRALREANIPVDFIGGTSGGAILGAEYAAGWAMNSMVRTTVELIVKQNKLLDFTFPLLSIYKGRGIGRALDAMFGGRQIENLWLPYFCVSSNLTTADSTIHRTGSLRQAVRASLSIPGVVPPVLADGDLLVDGGLLDNVPIGPTRQMCEGGPVIAVDVGVQGGFTGNYRFQDVLPANQLLLSRLNPFARDKLSAPNIVSVILRSVELNSVRGRAGLARQADLYLNPPVAGSGIFDRRADELVDIGYRDATDKIAAWAKVRPAAT